MSRCLRIAPTDNVAVALEPVAAGTKPGSSVRSRPQKSTLAAKAATSASGPSAWRRAKKSSTAGSSRTGHPSPSPRL